MRNAPAEALRLLVEASEGARDSLKTEARLCFILNVRNLVGVIYSQTV